MSAVVFASVFCVSVSSYAQDAVTDLPVAEALVNGYLENTGGEEAWNQLTSRRAKATMSMGPVELTGIVVNAMPNKQRIDINMQGQQIVQGFDGQTAWQINPFAGATTAQEMSPEEAKQFTQEEFQSPFLNYKEKGNVIEVMGKKEVEGALTYEVKLTKPEGDVEMYYFDTEYMVPIMQSEEIPSGPAQGQVAKTYFSDYQEVDGLMMPFSIETKLGDQSLQKITITEIEVNPELDMTLFSMPKE